MQLINEVNECHQMKIGDLTRLLPRQENAFLFGIYINQLLEICRFVHRFGLFGRSVDNLASTRAGELKFGMNRPGGFRN
ncbi:unnamed protein product [Protopolystoma xenopodis]|uniref:Uncharacterized protein n=1 Tax=Protopolystoma xenopodis TaxID=117903 RepID=A0A448XA02_9PLAT|nr:unnamed protein product [Protopolystoma xenopodis]